MSAPVKLYVSGPIRGYPDFEARFLVACRALRERGYAVSNPCDFPPRDSHGDVLSLTEAQYGDFLRADLLEMLLCDAVCVLGGWELSKGASLEVHVAQQLGILTLGLAGWLARQSTDWKGVDGL